MTKKYLLVGINNYPGTGSDLQGCLNDVADGKSTLTAKSMNDPGASGRINDAMDAESTLRGLGFTGTTLLNSQATRANILTKLKSLVANAKSGDSIVFYYSGHGSQVRDASGDESDGWDEVICPCDWPRYVSDDDFRTILAKAKQDVTIDIILDACHAGTGTREIDRPYTIRALPPIVGKVSERGRKTRAVSLVPGLKHVLWAACADGQTSAELSIGGKIRGAFSHYFWQDVRAGGTRAQIMADVCQRIAALGLDQVPQLEATEAETLEAAFT